MPLNVPPPQKKWGECMAAIVREVMAKETRREWKQIGKLVEMCTGKSWVLDIVYPNWS